MSGKMDNEEAVEACIVRHERAKAQQSVKPRLLLEWSNGRDRYRLIEKPGHEYVINKLAVDDLGEPRWDSDEHFFSGSANSEGQRLATKLVGAIKFLLHEETERHALKQQEVGG